MAVYPNLYGISVCAGYGGLDLGIGLGCRIVGTNYRTILYCEREAYAAANLVAKMEAGALDEAPVWSDLTALPARGIIERVVPEDGVVLLHGGIPCQPFSLAGAKKRTDDERHLWPAFWRVARDIGEIRKIVVIVENVRGFVCGENSGLECVLADLSDAGWGKEWDLFSACEAGAPHQRERIFLMAHAGSGGRDERRAGGAGLVGGAAPVGAGRAKLGYAEHDGQSSRAQSGGAGQAVCDDSRRQDCSGEFARTGESGELADTAGDGGGENNRLGETAVIDEIASLWPARPGQEQHGWEPARVVGYTESENRRREREPGKQELRWAGSTGAERMQRENETEPGLGGDADGDSGRLDECLRGIWADRLRLCGNGVVPVVAGLAFVTLWRRLFEDE